MPVAVLLHDSFEPARLQRPCGLLFFLIAATALLTAGGCATLPDALRAMAMPHTAKVSFEDARGPVSAARSTAILQKIEGKGGDSDILEKHLAYEQSINAGSPLVLGNKLTLLQNGPDTYKAMFAAIRNAKNHINLETYIFDGGEAGKQFADLLLERQAAGVQVNIIYDSVGGIFTPNVFFQRLRDGGISVLEFNPVNPMNGNKRAWLLNNRDHRRQLIIDGRVAFTGGINISDTYSSSPTRRKIFRKKAGKIPATGMTAEGTGWRDTHVRIEGPVVAEFQKLFMATWARQKGPALPAANYFPEVPAQGSEIVRAIGSMPGEKDNAIFLTMISAITHAEKDAHLTIAYFAPDPQLLKALTDAARRGVDVRLMLPGRTDSWAIFNLGRSYYTPLLRGGVKIHERHGSVMHAKTATIDGVWSTIGSTNMDWRSFLHNDEMNAVVLGRDFSTQMEAMFADDVREADAIDLAKWKRRGLWPRFKERMARIGAYWL